MPVCHVPLESTSTCSNYEERIVNIASILILVCDCTKRVFLIIPRRLKQAFLKLSVKRRTSRGLKNSMSEMKKRTPRAPRLGAQPAVFPGLITLPDLDDEPKVVKLLPACTETEAELPLVVNGTD